MWLVLNLPLQFPSQASARPSHAYQMLKIVIFKPGLFMADYFTFILGMKKHLSGSLERLSS